MHYKEELQHQYNGFCTIPSLWKRENPIGIPVFNLINTLSDFEKLLVISEKLMLGKRVERFFEHTIIEGTQYEMVLKNQQINDGKITIGELDFILFNKENNQYIHVELVCKFYLLDEPFDQKEQWIGPNRKDGLKQKLHKLKSKQFPLIYNPITKPYLSPIEPESIIQNILFKASLFVHIKRFNEPCNFEINNECILGWWIYFYEFTIDLFGKKTFHIPKKQNWLIEPKNCNKWVSFNTIKEEIGCQIENRNSPLCWVKNEDNTFERFFIVWWDQV